MKKFFKENFNKIKSKFVKDLRKKSDSPDLEGEISKTIDNPFYEEEVTEEDKNNKKEIIVKELDSKDLKELRENKEFLESIHSNSTEPSKGVKLFFKNIGHIEQNLIETNYSLGEIENMYYDHNHEIVEVFNNCLIDNHEKESEFNINPIFMVAAIGFHHTKGSIVEYYYPEKNDIFHLNKNLLNYICFNDPTVKSFDTILDSILNQLTYLCLPDAVHLTDNDSQFFIIQNYEKLLFGVSCYRQLKTKSKTLDSSNTRDCLQKAICIISTTPLFGNLYSKLNMTVSAFFNQETLMDKLIVSELYNNYQNISFKNINLNELNL